MNNKEEKKEFTPEPIQDDLPEEENYEILPEFSTVKSDLSFKIIVIGDSGVGKTCLALRALKGTFQPDSVPTIGFEFLNMFVKTTNATISLQIWDTCGQEAYASVVSKFYKRASMAILVYSISDRNSFESLDRWLNELRENASPDVKIALVGNKADLKDERKVSKEEALNYKISRKLDLIFESSAKHGDNSKNIFLDTAKLLYKEYLAYTKNKTMEFTKVEGANGTYETYSHPYGMNAKLPGRDKAIKLKNKKKKGKRDEDDDYMFEDDDNMGSCTKC
ncbi:MAG: GTP-binding protein [archaeon]|nr:GTP-binding protein [archaeon]